MRISRIDHQPYGPSKSYSNVHNTDEEKARAKRYIQRRYAELEEAADEIMAALGLNEKEKAND